MAQNSPAQPPLKKVEPWSRRIAFALQARAIQVAASWLAPKPTSPETDPNLTKTYPVRPHLPVRVFLPSSYTSGSAEKLPTLFTIHGGGFCIGSPPDDDAWNRAFADTHSILVIALNYSKAPQYPFPTALEDLESLYLAALDDQTLPIDRDDGGRVAIGGFSAGGNLTLGLCQRLSKLKKRGDSSCSCYPRAAVPVYGALDLSRDPESKVLTRYFKTDASLGPPRNADQDFLISMAPVFDYSYPPNNHDLRDPLLSPGPYADRNDLPPHVFVIAAELDLLVGDSFQCAKRLAGLDDAEAGAGGRVGRPEPGTPGELELNDKRFAWEKTSADGRSSVRWLLVPDVLHGFDSLPLRRKLGGEETMRDAEQKTKAYCDILGEWLLKTAFAK